MSFILDALRKSEHERQRRAGPAVADLAVVPPRPATPLVWSVVGALLLVNLAAVAWFLLRDRAPATDAVAVPAVVAPADSGIASRPIESVAPAGGPAPAVRPLVAEALPAAPPPAPDAMPPPAPDPLLLPPAPRAAAQQPVITSNLPAAPGTTTVVPRLDALSPQATAGLPVLNLDLHIFASDPAQRAVFINGRRYREGDSLPEGVDVVAITTDGAVLRHRGQRFLLSRP